MEAAPRLPMLSIELKVPTETTQFGPQLKKYIARFYKEDPDTYLTEINSLESLRAAAVRPSMDYDGIQTLKKYYCQLHFLKSRFPMKEKERACVQFSWKDTQFYFQNTSTDIRFEMAVIMYNIGALHSYLGTMDTRTNSEGMKMACSHFQCAAWAFQTVMEEYNVFITDITLVELVHFFQQVCLSQAQECILEKSMLDNRKATIIAKVAVQVYNYYRQSLSTLKTYHMEMSTEKVYKEWINYLQFKIAYYRCVALLFQGQQSEEQQKMGERVAYYQAALEQLEEAKKYGNLLKNKKQEINESLAFTQDVVEGKRKAAKNENEFIYHESVPEKDQLQEVKGASLVKGIPFSVADVDVSGPDIFARLVPMDAHEGASLYSEKKAETLRRVGELIESKDQALAEFMSSMQLDLVTKMHQATGIPQDLIDRAAALSARPTATQDLISVMGKLSNIYQEVESNLNEIDALLKEEEEAEKSYQKVMGQRPPSIIATDLAREAAKYREAHTKANESNQTLHRAMTAHVANLKVLQQPLRQLQHHLPTVELPNANVDEKVLKDLEALVAKIEEMRNQRAMLWAQLREAVHQDDITHSLVTMQPDVSRDDLFQQELRKHDQMIDLIEKNAAAQDNIKKALIDTYAKAVNTRKYIQDILQKRTSTINSLIASSDSYDDLLAKANKGIEFYTKLETNVTKLLQRIKSACKVQQEEREQMLSKNEVPKPTAEVVSAPAAPKLKDYLESRKKNPAVGGYQDPPAAQYQSQPAASYLPPGVRPAPLGSEVTDLPMSTTKEPYPQYGYAQLPPSSAGYSYSQVSGGVDSDLSKKMGTLMTDPKTDIAQHYYANYSNFVPQNYTPVTYPTSSMAQTTITQAQDLGSPYNPAKAFTGTTDSYRPLPSHAPLSNASAHMQYPDSSLGATPVSAAYHAGNYQYPAYTSATGTAQSVPVSQHSADTYYPQGYAPIQSLTSPSAASQSIISGSTVQQYHPVEYATSVPSDQAKYSYPSTYTSPAPNMSSTNAGVATYYTTDAGYYYPATGGTATQTYQPDSSDQTGSVGYAACYAAAQQYPSASGTTAYYPSQWSGGSTPSSSTTKVQGASQSYPVEGYGYSQTGTQYSGQYYQAGAVPGQSTSTPGYGGYYGESYAPPTVAPPSVTPQVAQNLSYSTTVAQNPPYSSAVAQNPPYSTTMAQNPPCSTTVAQNPPCSTTRESNVDLLSGLDFSISQAPLVPQQNVAPEPEKAEPKAEAPPKPAVVVKDEPLEAKRPAFRVLPSKPLNNTDVKNLFAQEADKYEKFVETLTSKTLSGPTALDVKWKEIQDKQDNESQRRIVSVARCYPMKNRFPDILPYDYSRVELCGTKDDYINASYVKDVSPYAPPFIVTQSPLPSTVGDFWTMIREQQVELIFCISSDNEIGDDVYWPKEKGQSLNVLNMLISLQSIIVKTHWTERLISVNLPEKRDSRVVMQLQFTSWPGSLFPTTADPFVDYALDAISTYQQQRCNAHPVLVHCSPGIGKSGLLCLLVAAILEATNNANFVPDLAALTAKLNTCRKNILRDREHLKFAYESFLAYMKRVVSQDKIKKKMNELVPKIKEEVKPPVEVIEKNVDPLSSLDPFWASKK